MTSEQPRHHVIEDATMQTLIERLEKATGPDREIDGAIALSIGWSFEKMKGDAKAYYRKPGVTEYYMRNELPPFTASIDAALTLVPEGLSWALWGDEHNQARVYERSPEGTVTFGNSWNHHDAATPAIAICIAALKARAAVSVTPA